MKFIDSHAHVHFPAYKDDIDDVLTRAREADIGIVTVGTEISTSMSAVDFAEKHDNVWATIGVHPGHVCDQDYIDTNEFSNDHFTDNHHHGQSFDEAAFARLVVHPKVVAIGECGLDYYHLAEKNVDDVMREKHAQQEALREQLAFASVYNKPLVVHCRPGNTPDTAMAHADQARLMREEIERGGLARRGVIHCFTGTIEEANVYRGLGFLISFPGIVTFGKNVMEVAKNVPLESILIETDCPYLTPAPHRGKRNEPLYVTLVAQKIADLKGVPLDDVAAITTQNAVTLFQIS